MNNQGDIREFLNESDALKEGYDLALTNAEAKFLKNESKENKKDYYNQKKANTHDPLINKSSKSKKVKFVSPVTSLEAIKKNKKKLKMIKKSRRRNR